MDENEGKLTERERRLHEALRFVLSDQRGQQLLWWILETCGIYRAAFTGNSATYFIEGQRDVGLKLVNKMVEVDPRSYAHLQLAIADLEDEIRARENKRNDDETVK